MKSNLGAQYEISIDGVPRTYRDRQDIALQTARFLKSRNPNSVVKLKDFRNPANKATWNRMAERWLQCAEKAKIQRFAAPARTQLRRQASLSSASF